MTQKMTAEDLDGIGKLVAALVERCLQSDVGGVYSVFAIGIAAGAVRSIGQKRALTDTERNEVLEVFKSGLAQQFVTLGTDEIDGVAFGGVIKSRDKRH